MEVQEETSMSTDSSSRVVTMNLGGGQDEVGVTPDLSGLVHHLPCCIKFDGPSQVSHYFKPKPTGTANDGFVVEKSYFRGRELLGATVPLPHHYSGFVIAKTKSAEDKHIWQARAKFSSVAFWNHDSLPSIDDACLRALHLLTVSNALHKPVTPEELAALREN